MRPRHAFVCLALVLVPAVAAADPAPSPVASAAAANVGELDAILARVTAESVSPDARKAAANEAMSLGSDDVPALQKKLADLRKGPTGSIIAVFNLLRDQIPSGINGDSFDLVDALCKFPKTDGPGWKATLQTAVVMRALAHSGETRAIRDIVAFVDAHDGAFRVDVSRILKKLGRAGHPRPHRGQTQLRRGPQVRRPRARSARQTHRRRHGPGEERRGPGRRAARVRNQPRHRRAVGGAVVRQFGPRPRASGRAGRAGAVRPGRQVEAERGVHHAHRPERARGLELGGDRPRALRRVRQGPPRRSQPGSRARARAGQRRQAERRRRRIRPRARHAALARPPPRNDCGLHRLRAEARGRQAGAGARRVQTRAPSRPRRRAQGQARGHGQLPGRQGPAAARPRRHRALPARRGARPPP